MLSMVEPKYGNLVYPIRSPDLDLLGQAAGICHGIHAPNPLRENLSTGKFFDE